MSSTEKPSAGLLDSKWAIPGLDVLTARRAHALYKYCALVTFYLRSSGVALNQHFCTTPECQMRVFVWDSQTKVRAIQIHSSMNHQPYNAFIKNPAMYDKLSDPTLSKNLKLAHFLMPKHVPNCW
ncbi:hypothetical protein V8E54_000179 [Elaphomyces granulatus]